MNQHRAPTLARTLTSLPSRRNVLRGLAGSGLGLGIARWQPTANAKKKHKHKKKPKKAKPNAFGCFDVGDPCKSADQCCSGICEGKKGKRKCRAHDDGTCDQKSQGVCEAGNPLLVLCNGKSDCVCFRTTGGSNVCAALFGETLSQCADCQKDADCLALGYPPGTTCAPITGDYACADICEGGMACMLPCGTALPEPPRVAMAGQLWSGHAEAVD
jgi:hypothetical protein